jgi:hypothetical protein
MATSTRIITFFAIAVYFNTGPQPANTKADYKPYYFLSQKKVTYSI